MCLCCGCDGLVPPKMAEIAIKTIAPDVVDQLFALLGENFMSTATTRLPPFPSCVATHRVLCCAVVMCDAMRCGAVWCGVM